MTRRGRYFSQVIAHFAHRPGQSGSHRASPSTPCHKTAMAAMRSELLLALLPRRGDNAELS